MDLPQQLEDKKKGCGKYIRDTMEDEGIFCGVEFTYYEDEIDDPDLIPHKATELCDKCKYEIAILEQAIAEIKNIQSQQTSKEIVSSSELATADISNLLQKQRQEILDKIRLEFHTFREEFIESELNIEDFDIGNLLYNIEQQLNQPKTEK